MEENVGVKDMMKMDLWRKKQQRDGDKRDSIGKSTIK